MIWQAPSAEGYGGIQAKISAKFGQNGLYELASISEGTRQIISRFGYIY